MITPQQIRGARAMLGLTQKQLADSAGLSEMSVKNIERGSTPDPRVSTILALKKALETAGVEFIPENGGGAGVRLRKSSGVDGGGLSGQKPRPGGSLPAGSSK